MTTARNLMGSGNPSLTTQAILGFVTSPATAAGTTQANALLLPSDTVNFGTVASGAGAILPAAANPGDTYWVTNSGANALLVYPPTGGTVGGGATNAGFSVAATKSVMIRAITALTFATILSA